VYELFLEGSAQRDLKKLPVEHFHRIVAGIRDLARDPRPPGSRKITGAEHDWRIRLGDYRVIYEIDEKAKAVRVMIIRHRREAYRRKK
jgi:mRNA interferase RelE/StbE